MPLTEGTGHIVDYNLETLKEDEIPFLRRKIGIVFQDFKLLPDRSINDNMLFVLKATGWTDLNDMNNKIEAVLTKVGMQDFGNKMPHQLSGGEQQRVALVKLMLQDSDIILADEPTSSLDLENEKIVMDILKSFTEKGKTVIIVTHNQSLHDYFTDYISLEKL